MKITAILARNRHGNGVYVNSFITLKAGLHLYLLGFFAAGEDSVPLESTIDQPEAAPLDLVPALQTFDHVRMRSRIVEVM